MISPYLISGAAGWVVAQGIKTLISLSRSSGDKTVRMLYVSGGMPSAHSATVVSLATTVAFIDGVDSAVFGVALTLALIVMYDAMMVRRSSGRQGEIISKMVKDAKSDINVPRFAKGHEPIEVFAGAILGLFIGVTVNFVT